jgi:hypothetical protein
MPWDYTAKAYKKQAKSDPVWALERQILYGDGKTKIKKELLKKYLHRLRIPPQQKLFLQLLIDEKKSSHARTKS